MKYLWYTTSRGCGDVGLLTHRTLPPGNVDTDMHTYMRYTEFCFFCNGAFICNVTAEFIVSYTYENRRRYWDWIPSVCVIKEW